MLIRNLLRSSVSHWQQNDERAPTRMTDTRTTTRKCTRTRDPPINSIRFLTQTTQSRRNCPAGERLEVSRGVRRDCCRQRTAQPTHTHNRVVRPIMHGRHQALAYALHRSVHAPGGRKLQRSRPRPAECLHRACMPRCVRCVSSTWGTHTTRRTRTRTLPGHVDRPAVAEDRRQR